MTTLDIDCYTDPLCIWAWFSEPRLAELAANYGARVRLHRRCLSVFGDTARKIGDGWAARGGYAGFNAHLRHAAAGFPDIRVHPDLWLDVRPASSLPAQLHLKAVALAAPDAAAAFETALRRAFFVEARDIAQAAVLADIIAALGIDAAGVAAALADGRAHAALARDHADAAAAGVTGSPTLVLNDGRQKLFGNIGYRLIEANVEELLRAPAADRASWC